VTFATITFVSGVAAATMSVSDRPATPESEVTGRRDPVVCTSRRHLRLVPPPDNR
jgi:hypothetical protein